MNYDIPTIIDSNMREAIEILSKFPNKEIDFLRNVIDNSSNYNDEKVCELPVVSVSTKNGYKEDVTISKVKLTGDNQIMFYVLEWDEWIYYYDCNYYSDNEVYVYLPSEAEAYLKELSN